MPTSSRLALLLVTASLGVGGRARADVPAGAGTLTYSQRFYNPSTKLFEVINPDQVYFHMNRATCLCSEHVPGDPRFQLGVFEQLTGVTMPDQNAMETWVGQSCDVETNRQPPPGGATCENIGGAGLQNFEDIDIKRGFLAQIPVDRFVEPYHTGCAPTAGANSVFDLLVNGSALDVAGSQSYSFDTQAPLLPTGFHAVGGENAIQIDFTPPTDTADILYYQALCATTDGLPALSSPQDKPHYDISRYKDGCNLNQDDVALQPAGVTGTAVPDAGVDASPADANDGDGGVPPPSDAGTTTQPFVCPAGFPTKLCQLDPAYVCQTITSGAELRIQGLKNNVGYRVVVLAIDKSGNASGVYLTDVLVPEPVTDFWEDLHDNGSQVESGFCLISDTYGDGGPITNAMRGFRDDNLGGSAIGRAFTRFYYAHVAWLGEYARAHWPVRVALAIVLLPFVLFALSWHVLTLPGLIALVGLAWWLRRRRRGRSARVAIAATATMFALVISATAAHAQDDPWTEPDSTDADASFEDDIGVVEPTWVVGVKLGPYIPGIDAQFHKQADPTMPALQTYYPYRHMFGGYDIMPVLEVDRVILDRLGQLTVGGSIGYLGKSGQTYQDGTSFSQSERPTASDTTAFHMVPLSLELGYRFTYLDDRWGIPIVPYAKGGLAYDLWWMRDPNGNFSRIGPDNCHPVPAGGTCMQAQQRAVGGSAGLIGAVGIAIRAERIDPASAASMREGGIEHAGFYAELQTAWVDGFGNAHRLSLGTTTWFAGVNFEF